MRVTPVIEWRDGVWLKLEHLQVTGSFKARGACNRVLAARAGELRGPIITASGGNHGLGVAYAATLTPSLAIPPIHDGGRGRSSSVR